MAVKKILIVKTTSMGDVIHALPAVHDIASALPGVQIDWVVEEFFGYSQVESACHMCSRGGCASVAKTIV